MKTNRKTRADQDAEYLAKAADTVRAFVGLAEALERRMMATMGSNDGSPEKARLFQGIIDGLMAEGPRGKPWIEHANHCFGLTSNYWNGLFKWEGHQTPTEKGAASLFEHEPEYVAGHLMAGASALAPVLAALAEELAAADADLAFRKSQKTRRAA
jgi:hypothetical protein